MLQKLVKTCATGISHVWKYELGLCRVGENNANSHH